MKAVKQLPAGFDKSLVEIEFKIENPKLVTQELILKLIDCYNQAQEFYDATDRDLADIYRMKIAMLFSKPHVQLIYNGGKAPEKID